MIHPLDFLSCTYNNERFLETQGETLTVVELRQKLAKIDQDKNKKVSCLWCICSVTVLCFWCVCNIFINCVCRWLCWSTCSSDTTRTSTSVSPPLKTTTKRRYVYFIVYFISPHPVKIISLFTTPISLLLYSHDHPLTIRQIQEAADKFQKVSDSLAELQVQLDAQQVALEQQRKAEEQVLRREEDEKDYRKGEGEKGGKGEKREKSLGT